MAKGTTKSRKSRTNNAKNQRRLWRAILLLLSKVAFTMAVLLGFYAIYLDVQVRERFEAHRYQAPALLYSRALPLKASEYISYERVMAELRALDYAPSSSARAPGEYNERNGEILLHRRAFDFSDGFEPSQRLLLRFQNGRLSQVLAWPSQQVLQDSRLEPQLIGRFAAEDGEDRLLVGLQQVPELLQQTLLLIEDQDFYKHHGVQPSAIARAALANIRAGRTRSEEH